MFFVFVDPICWVPPSGAPCCTSRLTSEAVQTEPTRMEADVGQQGRQIEDTSAVLALSRHPRTLPKAALGGGQNPHASPIQLDSHRDLRGTCSSCREAFEARLWSIRDKNALWAIRTLVGELHAGGFAFGAHCDVRQEFCLELRLDLRWDC